jgi:hypothetical protein
MPLAVIEMPKRSGQPRLRAPPPSLHHPYEEQSTRSFKSPTPKIALADLRMTPQTAGLTQTAGVYA